MNNTNLKVYFNSLPEVKRIHELEAYIDNNKEIKEKFNELLELQKLIVSSKEFNQPKQLAESSKKYNILKEEILNIPFLEEYLELLDIVDNMLKDLASEIEYRLDKKING